MEVSFFACQKAIARIYNSDREVKGTGFLISSRYLFTCAHVVIDVLGIDQENFSDIPNQEIFIDFPSSEDKVSRKGKVTIWQPCPTFFDTGLEQATFREDIALLELNEAILSSQINSLDLISVPLEIFDKEQPNFSVYGFPIGSDNGEKTEGRIFGVQAIRWLQLQVEGDIPLILGGYSGSPLYSETSQGKGIVGMTVASEYYYSDKQDQYIGGKKAYAIPATALAEVWFKQGLLIECLASCDYKWIQRAYDYCRPQDWNSKQPENLVEVVTDLYRYFEKKNENILIDFVLYLMVKAKLPESLKVKLRQWANKAFGVTEGEIAEKCDRLKESLRANQVSGQTKIKPRLWIILNEAGTADQYKIESAYYIKDINNYKIDNKDSYHKIEFESIENIKLSQLKDKQFCSSDLQGIIDKIPYNNSLRIEFFLPFNSLDLMPENWLIKDDYDTYPLGTQYPVVIRVLERLGYKKPYRYASIWQENWKPHYIHQLSEQGLICCELPLDEISRELRREEVLGLRCISPIQTHKKKPHVLIMQRGLPIALWFRKELNSCCGKEIYQRILKTSLTRLPQELCDARQAELENEQHLARHISLLWDNPTKLPYDAPTFSDAKI